MDGLVETRWLSPVPSSGWDVTPVETVAHGLQAGPAGVEQATAAGPARRAGPAPRPTNPRQSSSGQPAIWSRTRFPGARNWPREEGRTLAEGQGEVLRAAQIFRYYGNDGDRDAGTVFSSPLRGERILVTRKPLGVVSVVTPFNFPSPSRPGRFPRPWPTATPWCQVATMEDQMVAAFIIRWNGFTAFNLPRTCESHSCGYKTSMLPFNPAPSARKSWSRVTQNLS